jgi:hypothetical protein
MTSIRRMQRAIALATAVSFVGVVGTVAVPGAIRSAHAEASAADKETARTLMSEGRAKRADGDHKAALEAFKKADAIMHVPTTGLEVGRELEALGRLTEARDAYLTVSRSDPAPNEPKPFTEARKEAERLADVIAARIPSVKIMLPGVPDDTKMQITIDGVEVPSAVVGVPRKIDPGTHEVIVTIGTVEKKSSIEVLEAETKDLTIEFTKEELAGAAKVEAPKDTPGDKPPADLPPPEKKTNVLTYVGFGVAGAGLVLGSVTGLMSLSKASSAKSSCIDNKCPPSTHDDIESSKSLATISTISFVVAGAGAVVGVIGLLSPKTIQAETTPTAKIEPHVSWWIGAGSAGVLGSF